MPLLDLDPICVFVFAVGIVQGDEGIQSGGPCLLGGDIAPNHARAFERYSGGERLRGRKKGMSGFTSCETHLVLMHNPYCVTPRTNSNTLKSRRRYKGKVTQPFFCSNTCRTYTSMETILSLPRGKMNG